MDYKVDIILAPHYQQCFIILKQSKFKANWIEEEEKDEEE